MRDHCLSFPETDESTPFDETTLVYKVGGKMFACTDMVESDWVALKCDPDHAIDLKEEYGDIGEARHFNKKHWISVRLDGDLPASFIRKLIRDSYLLVVENMPKLQRQKITKAFIDFEESQKGQAPGRSDLP